MGIFEHCFVIFAEFSGDIQPEIIQKESISPTSKLHPHNTCLNNYHCIIIIPYIQLYIVTSPQFSKILSTNKHIWLLCACHKSNVYEKHKVNRIINYKRECHVSQTIHFHWHKSWNKTWKKKWIVKRFLFSFPSRL